MHCRALYCLLILSAGLAFAQKRPNIAVAPFVGDKNVSAEQLTFLTGKFAGELMNTQAFNVLDRGKMDYILKEQGFLQTGACNTSECQVQMGQLLGVDYIVAGNLVRFGSKYAFRADYIDVSSGKVVYFVEQSESGELENVYEPLCQGAAQKLAQKVNPAVALSGTSSLGSSSSQELGSHSVQPQVPVSSSIIDSAPVLASSQELGSHSAQPQVPADAIPSVASKPMSGKRKVALALWGSALLGSGGVYYFDSKANGYMTDYNNAATSWQTPSNRTDALATSYTDSYDNALGAKTYRNVGYGFSLTALVAGAVLWFLPEGK